VLVALATAALVVCPVALPEWVQWSVGATAAAALLGVATVIGMCNLLPATAEANLLGKLRRLQAIYLVRPGLLLNTTLLSIVVQAANVVLVWLVALALDVRVPLVYFAVAVPMVTLLTLLPSINGMGLREGGLILFLKPLGVSPDTALTLSLMWFAVFTTSSLLGGAIYLFGRFPRPGEQAEHGPLGHHSDQGRAGQLGAAA
jgi:uncharacterized membrane protein YbhN (UPF0104 family)